MTVVGAHAARGDCECVHGRLGQRANTVSSAAYLGVAVAMRRREPLVAAGAAAAGMGSVAYHGPGTVRGRVAHDAGVALLVAAIAARRRRPTPARRIVAAAVFAAAVVVHAGSRTGRRWCRPASLLQGHALWHVLSAAAVVVAFGAERPR